MAKPKQIISGAQMVGIMSTRTGPPRIPPMMATIHVFVTNSANDGKPAKSVKVSIVEQNLIEFTDADGRVIFPPFAYIYGKYTLRLDYPPDGWQDGLMFNFYAPDIYINVTIYAPSYV